MIANVYEVHQIQLPHHEQNMEKAGISWQGGFARDRAWQKLERDALSKKIQEEMKRKDTHHTS